MKSIKKVPTVALWMSQILIFRQQQKWKTTSMEYRAVSNLGFKKWCNKFMAILKTDGWIEKTD